jgi:hypothetical protein
MNIFWYVYDINGNPIFLVGDNKPGGNIVTVKFIAPYGMAYGEFDPETVDREDGGIRSFLFMDSNNGVFDYVPSEWMVSTYGVTPITIPIAKRFGVTLVDTAHVA